MTARIEETVLYRSLPVNGKDYKAFKQGQSINSKNPIATKSIRDHVLLGSKADFGSQFISTTKILDVALKYAAPVHTVIAINLQKYRESGGRVHDLSTEKSFTENVAPMDGDVSNAEAVRRRLNTDFGTNQYNSFTEIIYKEAALTNWECCRLFAVRSHEVLLEGEIPFHCVSEVEYAVHVVSVLKLPHQPHNIPFESFAASVASDQTCYADGDNGGLIKIVLKGSTDQFLLKQAKRNSLETGVLSSRELRSSIDLEFAAFDTYRRVAHYVPGVDIAVKDCIKITFRYEVSGELHAACDDCVLNCLLIRCLSPLHALLPVEKLVIPLQAVHDIYEKECGEDYEIPGKCIASTLQAVQKAAKQTESVVSPEMEQQCLKLTEQYFIRYYIPEVYCEQLFKGLAVDMLIGNVYVCGCYEKSGIAKSHTGNLYRLSADRALGNQIAESINADRRDDNAGNLLMESITFEATSWRIPMYELCRGLLSKLREIKKAVRLNKDDFYSEVYQHLDLPYDVKRSMALYPAQHVKELALDDIFNCTSISVIWKDYLLNRSEFLCTEVEFLEEQSRNADAEKASYVLEELYNLFHFTGGHEPFRCITHYVVS